LHSSSAIRRSLGSAVSISALRSFCQKLQPLTQAVNAYLEASQRQRGSPCDELPSA
jgi:hypothetical protein